MTEVEAPGRPATVAETPPTVGIRRRPRTVLGVRIPRRRARPAGGRPPPESRQPPVEEAPSERLAPQTGGRRWLAVTLGAGELLALLVWTLLFARPYLDLDPDVVSAGREYLSNIQTHFLWTRAATCGWCALWNGSVRGGYPALADPHSSMLHPLVMVTALAWGVAGGAKLAIVGAIFIGGLAQWWLGRVAGLGRVARTWSAGMAVVAGHLAGKLESGNFALLLSTAATALVLPPLLALGLDGGRSRRTAVVLGVTLALAGVAGQAYMQVGLALLLLPAVLLAAPRRRAALWLLGRRLALAGAIALLLAAPFLVPMLHFLPQFSKDTDPAFRSAQPFPFAPLNLVINDPDFFRGEALGKYPYPHLYVTFVGWTPVLLALLGLVALWGRRDGDPPGQLGRRRRTALFLAGVAVLAMWLASAVPLLWLAQHLPFPRLVTQLAGLRHPPVIAGLAVPPLLALAGAGLDRLLETLQFAPRPVPGDESGLPGRRIAGAARRLLILPLAVFLIAALLDARNFNRRWLATTHLDPGVYGLLTALRTPDLQWVDTPFGEHYWIEPALRRGLKLSQGAQGWYWAGRPPPEPVSQGFRGDAPPGTSRRTEAGGVPVFDAQPGREYAAVVGADGERTVCTAHGTGGDVDVTCDAPRAGTLTVKENVWSGWRASVDGRPVPLLPGTWLAVALPPGPHQVAFRYRPWDVPLGLLLSAAGVALAAYAWWRDGPRAGGQARAPAEGGSAA
jgi:hypothetical protein